ncbi:hypothetical protein QEH56_10870 [Pelagicoccus enzymogenes]|uniref:hypothetical protein n=1 Tax=Pelagicoccus enzymogenes TaxID=2773457 RepID=UPI0028100C94|nr:hypothetical protein [Pelagicoccus enzymogenes]MDQ8198655.1 hypothetical protein [Pelagicoccus enzymogenes]
MPLYAMEENEANNLLSGVYWNGDRWLVRRLVLRSDGTYIYTQRGDSRPPCDWTNREAYSGGAARHFELYRNLNWVLEGRWFFGSNKKHIIRLEIDQYQLKDTSGSLPMDAFLEIPVVPDPKEGNAVFVPTETAVFGEPLEEATVRFPGGATLSYDKRKGILLDTHDNWPPFKECIERKTDGDRWFYPTRTIFGKRLLPVKDSERTSGE